MINVCIIAPTLAERVGYKTLVERDPEITVLFDAPSPEGIDTAEMEDAILLIVSKTFSEDEDLSLSKIARMDQAVLMVTEDRSMIGALTESKIPTWGILPPDASLQELTAAIKAVNEGLIVFPPPYLSSLKKTQAFENISSDLMLIESLTPRETEVLELLAEGLANKQMARELDISEHTVKFHISSIYSKLGAASRTEAVRLGLQNGLITL